MSESNDSGPVSKVQINELQKEAADLNAQRPKPEHTMELTPNGPETKPVITEEAAKKNAEIDNQVEKREAEQARMQEWLDKQKGTATRDFDRVRDR